MIMYKIGEKLKVDELFLVIKQLDDFWMVVFYILYLRLIFSFFGFSDLNDIVDFDGFVVGVDF